MTNNEQIAEQAKREIDAIHDDPVEQLDIIHEAIKKIDTQFTEMSQEFKNEIYELSNILYDLIRGNDYTNAEPVYGLKYLGGEIYSGRNGGSLGSGRKQEFVPYLLEIEALLWQFCNLLHDGELTTTDLIYENINGYQYERDQYLKTLQEQAQHNSLIIYPNPTSDNLNIVLDNSLVSPRRYHTNISLEAVVTGQGTNPDGSSYVTTSSELAGHDRPFNPLGGLKTVESDSIPPYNKATEKVIDSNTVGIYDITGKKHQVQSMISRDAQGDYNCEIDVHSLPAGVYFIRVPATISGGVENQYITQKFIKI